MSFNADPDTNIDEVVLPALMRAARGSYVGAIRARLAEAGLEDLPRNGPHVLGGMVNHGVPARDLIRGLGISKQAASQLIDTLVIRGYLEREVDPEDRRRVAIAVTERGKAAAAAVRAAVLEIDAALAESITPQELAGLRAGLVALCNIRERMEDEARARAEQAPS